MKKYLLVLFISFITLLPSVKADSVISLSETNKQIYESASISLLYYNSENYSCNNYSSCYQKALELYTQSGYQYYSVSLYFDYGSGWNAIMRLYTFDLSNSDTYNTFFQSEPSRLNITVDNSIVAIINDKATCAGGRFCSFYQLYDTNFNFESIADFQFQNFYSTSEEDNIVIKNGSNYPLLKDLVNYNSWSEYLTDFDTEEYTTVNLDNYEYVLLYPKDSTKKEAYDVNLKVKGMIGITPIYEFGTEEKTTITDRCNVSYSDYTDYRLYILDSDIQNNAVYVVKSCQEASSFKFKKSDFLIFYVTEENKDDPVISIGNQTYHTIPFNQLSNSANKNEEENFIPGESGFSFADVISNLANIMTSFWGSVITFMGLVTKFFNTLPIEFRAVAITSFVTACTLGLIKIFVH